MTASFTYAPLPARVLFGAGRAAELPAEVAALGARRAMLLSTPDQREMAARIAAPLDGVLVAGFSGAAMHTPLEVTERALEAVREAACDVLVAVGGGSTTGLAKALALRTDLPQVVIPTTYAGSEVTSILGQTEGGMKSTLRSPKVLPEVVIYDPELTLSLSPALSATSGLNAIAHAVEALYAHDANPVVSLMAEEGIRALGATLPAILGNPRDEEARAGALYGAWLCGTCLGAVGMALHHKLCHVLGGTFDLSHAETHAVVLPHVAAYNAPAAPEAMGRAARALGTEDAGVGFAVLAARLGTPRTLRDLGMPEEGIATAVRLTLESTYPNPRTPDAASLTALLRRAWAGEPPAAD
ncbi:maleylacetate reductase [Roseomonas populi]|uniref:Maleylacetate reductase n=1 Tax=Roseomonas populi TaxID=3121582 RepID=A0ABT1XBU9_9PROT|nr:maleylacetate reductase [Roseomonas pecuniae]MCR0985603.1 maleylacetate reductase [Roseomonas pecuniae]